MWREFEKEFDDDTILSISQCYLLTPEENEEMFYEESKEEISEEEEVKEKSTKKKEKSIDLSEEKCHGKKVKRRAIRFEGIDKEIEIGKFVVVKAQKKQFFYLEEMKDGKFRLTVTENLIPDIKKVKGLTIIREG